MRVAADLPLSQYPPVAPPTIQIDCNYPGPEPRSSRESIAAPIEQQVNGVEDMLYMSSQCTSDGSYTLTVTFKSGTNLEHGPGAGAKPRGPGDAATCRSGPGHGHHDAASARPEILLTVGLSLRPNGRYDQLYLSNYAVLRLREELTAHHGHQPT